MQVGLERRIMQQVLNEVFGGEIGDKVTRTPSWLLNREEFNNKFELYWRNKETMDFTIAKTYQYNYFSIYCLWK